LKDIILLNPFRVLGLPVEATPKEIAKRISDIEIFDAMGKKFSSHYDQIVDGEILRDDSSLNTAKSKLEMHGGRLIHSLFWFGDSKYDEANSLALKYLLDSDYSNAQKAWQKAIKDKISYKNAISFKNYSAYLLQLSLAEDQFNFKLFLKGISIACEFLNSNYFEDYSWMINGDEYSLNRTKCYQEYCDIVIKGMIKDERTSPDIRNVIKALEPLGFDATQYAVDVLTRDEVRSVERMVRNTRLLREEYPNEAHRSGKKLGEEAKGKVRILKSLFPKGDLRYQIVSDKFSEELLQCSIEYFNKCQERPNFEVNASIELLKLSKQYAVSERLKDKIGDNISFLDEWQAGASDRRKFKIISAEVEYIHKQMTEVSLNVQFSSVASVAISLLNTCKPKLRKIRNTLGSRNETYLQISDALADNVLGICLALLNAVAEEVKKHYELSEYDKQSAIYETVESTIPVFNEVGRMDLTRDMLNTYSKICRDLGINATSPQYL
jgi:hypothetical protein